MSALTQWYMPEKHDAVTSPRMIQEIIMMNKQKIGTELRFLKESGSMVWVIALPPDEECKQVWRLCLVYDKDFSRPECKEPFKVVMCKPTIEELEAAVKKGGVLSEKFIIPVNKNKKDLTCVEAVENIINWRKSIYKYLDFSVNEAESSDKNTESVPPFESYETVSKEGL